MKFKLQILVAVLVTGLVITAAPGVWAITLDFEDLYPGRPLSGYLANGYAGLSWSQSPHATWMTSDFVHQYGVYNSGLDNGITGHVGLLSLSTVRGGAPLLWFSSTAPIDFFSADITAYARVGLDVTVEGWLGGTLLYSQTVITDSNQLHSFEFNFNHIDTVMFKPGVAGSPDPDFPNWTRRQIVVDNINYIYNPEPSSIMLLGAGLLGFGLWRRMKKGLPPQHP